MKTLFKIAGLLTVLAGAANAVIDPAVTRLGEASAAYDKRDFFTTVHLLSAPGQPAKLRDYVTYYLANAELLTNNGDGALKDLEKYASNPISGSPYSGRLSLLHAKALLGAHPTPASAAKARQILEAAYPVLPEPDGDLTLGQACEATGFPRLAADHYQRVYFSYPADDSSAKAKQALDRLKPTLGSQYPEPTARQQLDRAAAWIKAKQYTKARQEYAMLAESLSGPDRDAAQAGVGGAMFLDGDVTNSQRYLEPLHPEDSEAAAQRLYYLTEAYRKAGDDTSMLSCIQELAERHSQSPWRLKALITAGNRFLLTQDKARYVPLYQAVADSFPGDPAAALSHWRVVWAAWLEHSPRRTELLRTQVEKFPADTHVSDALYFLGRAAETDGNSTVARAYYDRLAHDYPHYYYSELAKDRLSGTKLVAINADAAVHAWLDKTIATAHSVSVPTEIAAAANEATKQRIDRGRLLISAGLQTQAVEELQFGARQGNEQPVLLAMELSRAMPTPYLSMKIMKKFTGDYLSLPFENAPRSFWEMLFPLPYQDSLTASAMDRDLDPYAVAGLIRQESEFNPGARSAVAYGLMQLIPSTGRMLGRRDGIPVPSAGMLLNPSLNIKLGTQYLRSQLNQWGGDWVKTLAAYNAGPTRVREWINQYGYGDPAEFIENIPFSETRDYVQAVLRNGQVYRELYGRDRALLAPDFADGGTVPAARITNVAAVSKVVAKRPLRTAVVKSHAKKATRPSVAVKKSTSPRSVAATKHRKPAA